MASVLGILLLGVVNLGIPNFFLVLALLNAGMAALLFARAPEFLQGLVALRPRRRN